jgi:uncharacterized protein YjbI with pentapeptide repeats
VITIYRTDGTIAYQSDTATTLAEAAHEGRVHLTHANLAGVNLSDADLTGVNLTNANLSGADLTGSTLTDATLYRAKLTRANLSRANLTDATLIGVDLSSANLTDADLTRANLAGANLYRANLTGADLYRANLTNTTLTGANLSGAVLAGADGHQEETTMTPIVYDAPTLPPNVPVGYPTLSQAQYDAVLAIQRGEPATISPHYASSSLRLMALRLDAERAAATINVYAERLDVPVSARVPTNPGIGHYAAAVAISIDADPMSWATVDPEAAHRFAQRLDCGLDPAEALRRTIAQCSHAAPLSETALRDYEDMVERELARLGGMEG